MPRYTLCVGGREDDPESNRLVFDWLERWRGRLDYCSRNYGCGCCVDLFDIEAPAEAVAELPDEVFAGSEWVRTGRRLDTA